MTILLCESPDACMAHFTKCSNNLCVSNTQNNNDDKNYQNYKLRLEIYFHHVYGEIIMIATITIWRKIILIKYHEFAYYREQTTMNI